MPSVRLAPFLALAWLAACGGKIPSNSETSDAATTPGDTATEPPFICSWPPSFEPLDATPMRDNCRAARMLVTCDGTDGSGSICLNDEEKCALPTRTGVTYKCKNQCKPTEFAAKCGGLMGSSVVPPADCRRQITPPGGPLYCCTCDM
ncbi:MAG TPA: hypothetical protein VK540_16980 [Polyangiaceae bacterium]|nr:hypothetical protein [Polyangiaceae bacterium]